MKELTGSFELGELNTTDRNKVFRVWEYLKKKASEGSILTYTDLNLACDLDFNFNQIDDRNRIAHILGFIARQEVTGGRPMLSAIVVLKGHSPIAPAYGFYSYAEELGIHTKDEDSIFWAKELRRCFDFWRNK